MSESEAVPTATHDAHVVRRRRRAIPAIIALVFLLVLFPVAFRFACYEMFRIPSASMIPAILVGDNVIVSKFAYGVRLPFSSHRYLAKVPERGDVVLISWPGNARGSQIIKRVIGLPGDRIDVRDRHVFINGSPVESTAPVPVQLDDSGDASTGSKPGTSHSFLEFEEHSATRRYSVIESEDRPASPQAEGSWTVEPNHVFVLGDNRDNSMDSRTGPESGGYGQVPLSSVEGRATTIAWSFGARGLRSLRTWQAIH